MKKIISWIVVIGVLLLVFWLGQRVGSRTVNQQILSNSLIVREIAELATLEVQGNASIKRSNVENDGSWTDNLKKVFAENTVWVNVPYTAKYGVTMDEKDFKLTPKEGAVLIELPAPRLLSYELRLNQMETGNSKGWLMFSDDETYTSVQKSLYESSRQQLQDNNLYIDQSKEKIRKIITQYYAPLNLKVEVKFAGERGNIITLP
ncbi:uncharacterized protein DUF4230 [Chitinophaga skermanii]|uniref:Uncharacterized protein DUF4230 n=1 Tax=Chitinophaga skermanii TaxID=331697 RepID=A0A327QKN9_9BACT|nr:DUF4230 domain-containing protein [Chitinophaga skermanii]RAJ05099.1 uncharacterized protein DUF4230 [Chitinophaga skermanii]